MESAQIWGIAHAVLFVAWLVGDVAVLALIVRVKNPARDFPVRLHLVRVAGRVYIVPRLCFALMLITGIELTGAVGVYPLTQGLRTAAYVMSLGWAGVIVAGAATVGTALSANLRIIELVFEAFTGLAFVAYGLNSLATGAPIDDTWFAAKLFVFGLVFWTAIATDIGFRPFYAPFSETATEGATPEREEAITAAINHSLAAKAVLLALVLLIAFLGHFKPF